MLDRSFVEKIEALTAPTIFPIGGLDYASKGLVMITPPQVAKFSVESLAAILDFCEFEMESEKRHVLHIQDYHHVKLYGPVDPKFRTRECFVAAEASSFNFEFETFHQVEKFIIALQAQFVQSETTAAILKLVGNMTKVAEVGTKDNGVTQVVEVKSGLAKVDNFSVPNPVNLAPFRTFIEIKQPASNFVLRMNDRFQCGLFEADGGAWMIAAMKGIREFLDSGLKAIGKRDQITILC